MVQSIKIRKEFRIQWSNLSIEKFCLGLFFFSWYYSCLILLFICSEIKWPPITANRTNRVRWANDNNEIVSWKLII